MFVGREKDIEAIKTLLNLNNKNICNLFIVSNQAGIGKTELLLQLKSTFSNQAKFGYLDLSFLEELDYPQFLGGLRDILHSQHQLTFSRFDLFYPLLLKSTHPDLNIKSVEIDGIADLISASIEQLSESISFFKTGLSLKKNFEAFRELQIYRSTGLTNYLKQIKSPSTLKDIAIQIFIDDLKISFKQLYPKDYVPFIIAIDNYHLIDKFSESHRDIFNQCITQLTKSLPEFFFVLSVAHTSSYERAYPLKPLSEEATYELLGQSDIKNKDMQQAIYKLTSGIPAHIMVCINNYNSLDEETKSNLDVSYFDSLITPMCNQNWHIAILRNPQAMKLLAIPNQWTKELFCATFPSDIISSSLDFQYLCTLPFMKPGTRGDCYELTSSMREYLQSQFGEDEQITYYHTHFYNFYIRQLTNTPAEDKNRMDHYFKESLYHLCSQYRMKPLEKAFWYDYKTHLEPYYANLTPMTQVDVSKELVSMLKKPTDFSKDIYQETCCMLAAAYNTVLQPKSALDVLDDVGLDQDIMSKIQILYHYTRGNTYALLEDFAEATNCFIAALNLLIPSLDYTGEYLSAMDMLNKILLSAIGIDLELPLEKEMRLITLAEARIQSIDRVDYRLSYLFQLANVYYNLANYYKNFSKESLSSHYAEQANKYFEFYIGYLNNNYDTSYFNEEGKTEQSLAYIRASIGYILSLQMIEEDCDETEENINARYTKILDHCQKVLGPIHRVTRQIQATIFKRQLQSGNYDLDNIYTTVVDYIQSLTDLVDAIKNKHNVFPKYKEFLDVLRLVSKELIYQGREVEAHELYIYILLLLPPNDLENRIDFHTSFIAELIDSEQYEVVSSLIEEDVLNCLNLFTEEDKADFYHDIVILCQDSSINQPIRVIIDWLKDNARSLASSYYDLLKILYTGDIVENDEDKLFLADLLEVLVPQEEQNQNSEEAFMILQAFMDFSL